MRIWHGFALYVCMAVYSGGVLQGAIFRSLMQMMQPNCRALSIQIFSALVGGLPANIRHPQLAKGGTACDLIK